MDEAIKKDLDEALRSNIATVLIGLEQFAIPEIGKNLDQCLSAIEQDEQATPKRFAEMLSAITAGTEVDANDLSPELRRFLPRGMPTNGKAKAGYLCTVSALIVLMSCLDAMRARARRDPIARVEATAEANRWLGFMLGVLQGFNMNTGLQDQQAEQVRRAAQGRRLIGASTRERVRAAAEQHRHLTKGKAAFEIAPKVQLSSDRVLKLLSELYPGDQWSNRQI